MPAKTWYKTRKSARAVGGEYVDFLHPCPVCGRRLLCSVVGPQDRHVVVCPEHGRHSYTRAEVGE